MAMVPTMGALHQGHVSLGTMILFCLIIETIAELARKECDVVISSIFVNPAQFAPTEDLDKYPKTLDQDLKLLSAAGADYAFLPSVCMIESVT